MYLDHGISDTQEPQNVQDIVQKDPVAKELFRIFRRYEARANYLRSKDADDTPQTNNTYMTDDMFGADLELISFLSSIWMLSSDPHFQEIFTGFCINKSCSWFELRFARRYVVAVATSTENSPYVGTTPTGSLSRKCRTAHQDDRGDIFCFWSHNCNSSKDTSKTTSSG
ncbi:hypothetical protein M011DRAFT_512424 [Sporormia fimetaria CBS 119925]|uniref:Uncharacterized protein n=1 Tax=Sporormia fimetaria CBS 119925 TaxID=1340428 RepID=A0A6A6UY28_9PLEO|nr:hypothetical protein M011DRAFT_512424 [Sporormia fimetaria CBS 119925]